MQRQNNLRLQTAPHVHRTGCAETFDRPCFDVVRLTVKREKCNLFLSAELPNSSGTGVHEKVMNERNGHGTMRIINEMVRRCRCEPLRRSVSGSIVSMSFCLDQ